MTFKEQIEDLLKDSKVLKEESNVDFELSKIDKNLEEAVDNQTNQTINKLFERK